MNIDAINDVGENEVCERVEKKRETYRGSFRQINC